MLQDKKTKQSNLTKGTTERGRRTGSCSSGWLPAHKQPTQEGSKKWLADEPFGFHEFDGITVGLGDLHDSVLDEQALVGGV